MQPDTPSSRPVVQTCVCLAAMLAALLVAAGRADAQAAKAEIDLVDRLKEIGYSVDDALKAGLTLPHKSAADLMAELTELRAKFPLDKMFPNQQARWHRSAAYCRLSLGRVKEAAESAAAWIAVESTGASWTAAHEAALASGDPAAAVKALRSYFKFSNTVFTSAGKKPPNINGISNEELAKLMASPEQEKEREAFLDSIAKITAPVGKKTAVLNLVDPKNGKKFFEWKKDTGKAIVLVVWNSTVPSAQVLFSAYRDLHQVFGTDERVAFLSVNLLEGANLKAAETEAIKAADLPGITHQEMITSPTGVFQKTLGNPPYPVMAVIGPDGVIKYCAGPKKLTSPIARQVAFVLTAALQGAEPSAK